MQILVKLKVFLLMNKHILVDVCYLDVFLYATTSHGMWSVQLVQDG